MNDKQPIILALETSTDLCSVALVRGDAVLGEAEAQGRKIHSLALPGIIEKVLRVSGCGLGEVEAVAVATGPGSFTGLRVGVATAKALAYAAGLKLVGVPTLEALVWGSGTWEGLVCPMLDAGNEAVFFATYLVREGGPEMVSQPRRAGLAEVVAELEKTSEKIFFIGNGAHGYWPTIAEGLPGKVQRAKRLSPRGVWVAAGAEGALARGRTADPLTLLPFYLRPSQAELHKKVTNVCD